MITRGAFNFLKATVIFTDHKNVLKEMLERGTIVEYETNLREDKYKILTKALINPPVKEITITFKILP